METNYVICLEILDTLTEMAKDCDDIEQLAIKAKQSTKVNNDEIENCDDVIKKIKFLLNSINNNRELLLKLIEKIN